MNRLVPSNYRGQMIPPKFLRCDLGTHALDFVMWIWRQAPVEVYAARWTGAWTLAEHRRDGGSHFEEGASIRLNILGLPTLAGRCTASGGIVA